MRAGVCESGRWCYLFTSRKRGDSTRVNRITSSPVAKSILDDWEKEVRWFVKVMPIDYRNALAKKKEIEEAAARLSQRQTAKA